MGSLKINVSESVGIKDKFGGDAETIEFNAIRLLKIDPEMGSEKVVYDHSMKEIMAVKRGSIINIKVEIK